MNKLSNAEVLITASGFRLASGENSQYRFLRSRIFASLDRPSYEIYVLIHCISVYFCV